MFSETLSCKTGIQETSTYSIRSNLMNCRPVTSSTLIDSSNMSSTSLHTQGIRGTNTPTRGRSEPDKIVGWEGRQERRRRKKRLRQKKKSSWERKKKFVEGRNMRMTSHLFLTKKRCHLSQLSIKPHINSHPSEKRPQLVGIIGGRGGWRAQRRYLASILFLCRDVLLFDYCITTLIADLASTEIFAPPYFILY